MRKNLVVSVAFGVFVAFVLPFQTYLGNTADYVYSGWRLLGEQGVAALAVSAAVYVLVAAGARWLADWVAPILVALLAAVWIESSYLSYGLGELNGEMPVELGQTARRVWDSVALVFVFLTVVLVGRRFRKYLALIALVPLAMGGLSLFDVRPSTDRIEEGALREGEGGLAISSEIIRNVAYSPTRNVLMFVLDTMPGTVACDVMADDPALRAAFPGFTAYRNNIGMHDCTKRGVPALMTGRYYQPGESTPAYMMSVLGTNSFLQAFRDRGDAIYCICDVLSYGFTTAKTERHVPKAKRWRPAVAEQAREIPYMSLLDVAAYRACPFALKEKFLFQKLHSRKTLEDVNEHFVNEHVMYPQLAEKPVSSDPRQMFGKFHTFGAHMPLMFDADGKPVVERRRDAEVQRQAVSNALVQLSRLMATYRERGIYDKSFIVVTTDHGSKLTPHPPGAHGQATALLWVKPDGCADAFAESAAPTTHAQIAPLVRRAAEGSLSASECEEILRSDCRLFRYIDRKDERIVYDWTYHPDGSFDKPANGYPSR